MLHNLGLFRAPAVSSWVLAFLFFGCVMTEISSTQALELDEFSNAVESELLEFDPINLFGLPPGAVEAGGKLIIGGGGDLPESVFERFVQLAGGTEARIVLIPSAYPYDSLDEVQEYFSGWNQYNLRSLDFLHTDQPDEADDLEFCKALEQATGVWLPGGAQARLTSRYGGRRVERLIQQVLIRGGVVGGTSAGASVQSELMICHGTYCEANLERGLGLTKKLVIDQHFSQRGRYPRLLGVLEDNPGLIGLGVDENTAVVLEGNTLSVIGEGRATVIIGPRVAGEATTVYRLKPGETAEANRVLQSAEGPSFSLQRLVPPK